MKRFICLCVPLMLAGSVLAEVGDLKPTADSAGEALFGQYLYARQNNFAKRTEGDGTVNKHAMIATLKAGSGLIKAAIDTKSPETKSPDIVRFDFTGKGKFDDKVVVPLNVSSRGRSFNATFGPVTINVRRDGRTIPVSVQGHYYKRGNYRRFQIRFGTAMQGTCKFGEKTLRVRIIDGNNNLRCNDKTKPNIQNGKIRGIITGDTMLIYPGDGGAVRKVLFGQPVKVNDKWYQTTLSADGAKILAKPVEVKTGKIRINHKRWSATLIGTKHLLTLSGGDEEIEVPVGQYVITNYTEFGPGAGRRQERLVCRGREVMRGKGKVFDVTEGKTTEIAVGSPVKAGVDVRTSRGSVNFTLKLADASGSRVDYVTPRPPPPVVEVFDASGNKVYGGKMRYG